MSSRSPDDASLSAEVVARNSAWPDPVSTATRLLAIIDHAVGGITRVSRDDGDWTTADRATVAGWFASGTAAVTVAGDGDRRGALSEHRRLNSALVRQPAAAVDRGPLVAAALDLARAMPDLTSAGVRTDVDRWPLYEAHGLLTLGDEFGEMLDWVHVLAPAVAERIGRDRLLTAPVASVSESDGWVILTVFDDPADPTSEDAERRIVATTRHLQGQT